MNTIAFTKKRQLISLLFLGLFSPVLFVSCKKERVAASFDPAGYWHGNAAHHHTAILNKTDGKSRIYFRIYGIDTAGATIGDGFYTITGSRFKAIYSINNNADSILIESILDQSGAMNGKLYTTVSPDIVDCHLLKQ